MSFQGHIENGVVVFDERVTLVEGTTVRVEAVAPPQRTLAEPVKSVIGPALPPLEDPGCFRDLPPIKPLDAGEKAALRALLTKEQFEALMDVASRGGPDIDTITRMRAKSMT